MASSGDDDSFLRELARAPDRAPDEAPPERLAQFRIVERIGKGGMGVVYRAVDEKLGREVALKVLPPAFERDEERRRRFLREARAAAAVTHPNLITVFEVDEAGDRIFIAMELVAGRTLRQRLAEGKPSLEEAVQLFREITRGVAKAHERGIVHRDLKPDNVMLTGDGGVKVLDFGLAKQRATDLEHADTQTNEGRIVGTPEYMSPEQAAGRSVDARSDVFSLGVILYELVAGQRPFRGASAMDVLVSVARDEPPPPKVSAALQATIARCIEKDPQKRFADARALEVALAQPSAVAPRRFPRTAVTVTVAAVCLVAISSAAVYRQHRAPQAPPPAAPKGIGLLDLPLPESKSAEARAAYRSGMQNLHDSNWGRAYLEFRRAAVLDPTMAAAHLRVAFTSFWTAPADVLSNYAKAVGLRSNLDPRSRDLLDALEPRLGRVPPDDEAYLVRLRALAEKYPEDGELAAQLAWFEHVDDVRLAQAERATRIDPTYADAWQLIGRIRLSQGRPADAEPAYRECLKYSPQAADCHWDLIRVDNLEGKCADAERHAERNLEIGFTAHQPFPPVATGATWRASAAFAIGRPPAALEEIVRGGTEPTATSSASLWREVDQARLAVLLGDFAGVEQHAHKLSELVAGSTDAGIRSGPPWLLAQLYLETGRLADADRVAAEYLARAPVWTSQPTRTADAVPLLLAVRRRTGRLGEADYRQQVRTWLASRKDDPRSELGVVQHTWSPLAERDEAELALAELARFHGQIRSPLADGEDRAWVARLPLVVGRPAEALPQLEAAARSCSAMIEPFQYTKVHLWLGQAREATGDRAGACSAYRVVVERWGKARPRSVSAEAARARLAALGCK